LLSAVWLHVAAVPECPPFGRHQGKSGHLVGQSGFAFWISKRGSALLTFGVLLLSQFDARSAAIFVNVFDAGCGDNYCHTTFAAGCGFSRRAHCGV